MPLAPLGLEKTFMVGQWSVDLLYM